MPVREVSRGSAKDGGRRTVRLVRDADLTTAIGSVVGAGSVLRKQGISPAAVERKRKGTYASDGKSDDFLRVLGDASARAVGATCHLDQPVDKGRHRR